MNLTSLELIEFLLSAMAAAPPPAEVAAAVVQALATNCGEEPEGPAGEPTFSATDSKLGLEPSPLNSFRMEENLLFCFILFLSFSYSSTRDCLWTGLVAVAGKGCEEEPMTGKSLDGGLVLLLPRISSISDPPRGKDLDLSK